MKSYQQRYANEGQPTQRKLWEEKVPGYVPVKKAPPLSAAQALAQAQGQRGTAYKLYAWRLGIGR